MSVAGVELTPPQREQRRLVAAALLRAGWRQVDIADELGVTRGAVSQWAKALRRGGVKVLMRRPHRGRASPLSDAQWKQLRGTIVAGAVKAGFPTERWTLRRVALLIERKWQVRYHPNSLGIRLHRLGLSAHRPRVRARERNDALVRAWLRRDWPRIKRGLDEAGVRLPSWTRQVTRFGPDSAPPGRPSARRLSLSA